MSVGVEAGVGALLTVDALAVTLSGVPILRDVSLHIAAGEIVGLVGASGSGKSMLSLAVMGLLPEGAKIRGSIRLEGRELVGCTDAQLRGLRGRAVSIVFQEPMTALNPLMRVVEQVAEVITLHRVRSHTAHRATSRVEARREAQAALTSVGLRGERGEFERYPHELSGGQRQRVAIAMAIVLKPALLIADEPTTALDVQTQAQVLDLLVTLARDGGMGLLLVSHDLALIAGVADRVAVMQGGEIVQVVSAGELGSHLEHPYTRALLAAAVLAPLRPPAAASATVLEVRDVVRVYAARRRSWWAQPAAVRAVDGVSLHVDAGETVGLVGESGSGKSSLLRAVLALDPLQGGDVRLNGESLSAARGAVLRRLRRSIQGVFQDPYGSFDPQWTVESLVAEPFHLLDRPPDAVERRAAVVDVLEQVGLNAGDLRKRAREFSGGERQRIAIARALVTRPAVVAFDEAVSALDVIVRAQILTLLADLAQRLRLAYLFVSHDINVVRAIADRVYVMQRGRIVEEGLTGEVFGAPRHDYTRALVAATPSLAGIGLGRKGIR